MDLKTILYMCIFYFNKYKEYEQGSKMKNLIGCKFTCLYPESFFAIFKATFIRPFFWSMYAENNLIMIHLVSQIASFPKYIPYYYIVAVVLN